MQFFQRFATVYNGAQFCLYPLHQALLLAKVDTNVQQVRKVRGWQHCAWRGMAISSEEGACIFVTTSSLAHILGPRASLSFLTRLSAAATLITSSN